MKATQIVTIKSFSPMFKGEEEATNIQIVNVEEHGFNIVIRTFETTDYSGKFMNNEYDSSK
jgi:hypothetical protein